MKIFDNKGYTGISYKLTNTGVIFDNNIVSAGNYLILEFDKLYFTLQQAKTWLILNCPFGYSEQSHYRKWVKLNEFEENNSYSWALEE